MGDDAIEGIAEYVEYFRFRLGRLDWFSSIVCMDTISVSSTWCSRGLFLLFKAGPVMLRRALLDVRTACTAFLGRGVKNFVNRRGVIGGGFFGRETVGALLLLSSAMAKRACLTGELFSGVCSMAVVDEHVALVTTIGGKIAGSEALDSTLKALLPPAMHKSRYELS